MKKVLIIVVIIILILAIFVKLYSCVTPHKSILTETEAIEIVRELMESNGFVFELAKENRLLNFLVINNKLNASMYFSRSEYDPGTLFYRISVTEKIPIKELELKSHIIEENPIIYEIDSALSSEVFNQEEILEFEKIFIDNCNNYIKEKGVNIELYTEQYYERGADLRCFYSYCLGTCEDSSSSEMFFRIDLAIHGIVK